ncbi:MAG TPA: SRPBCC family protein [Candidatus Limnocylindrales bacterium]
MGRISASVALPYPPELVFRVATRIADLPRWMPEVVSADLLDPTLAVGSRVRLRLSSAAAGAEVVAAVTQLTPPARLVLNGSGGPLGVTVSVSLRATASGGSEATVDVELTTPPFLGFVAREAERKLDAGLPGALERLRALIEAEPA